MKIRGFELVEKYKNETDLLPVRETAHAAGYDLKAAETVTIQPGEIKLVPTGLKAYMQDGEVLYLYDRSSGNEGLMYGQFINITDKPVTIEKGTRMVQAVFAPFLVADGDNANGKRVGGFGSTGH